MPGGQARKQPFAGGAHVDPVRIVATEAEAVTGGFGIGKRGHARHDMQVAIAVLHLQRRLAGDIQFALAASQADTFDQQLRSAQIRTHRGRIEHHDAVGCAAQDLPRACLHQRGHLQGRTGKSVVHVVHTHQLAAGVDPNQPTMTGDPGHATGIDHQAGRRDHRKFLVLSHRIQVRELLAVPEIAPQLSGQSDPDDAAISLAKHIGRQGRRAADRNELVGMRIPSPQPGIVAQPDLPIRPDPHVQNSQRLQPIASIVERPEQLALAAPQLHPVREQRHPDAALCIFGHPARPADIFEIGCGLLVPEQWPTPDLACLRVVSNQPFLHANPDRSPPAFDDGIGNAFWIDRGQAGLDAAGNGIEMLKGSTRADQPDPARDRGRRRKDRGVGERLRIVCAMRKQREGIPAWRQVPQPALQAGKPQTSFAVLVGGDPVPVDQTVR